MRSFPRLFVALILLGGCHGGGVSTLAGASTMTALALGSSAVSRASGGCYAMCTNGTACNTATGFCEVLPCRNRCSSDEHCEVTYAASRCVSGSETGVAATAKGHTTKIPVVPPEATNTSGPPVVVPKAEQH